MAIKTRTKNLPPWMKREMDEDRPAPKHPVKRGKKSTRKGG